MSAGLTFDSSQDFSVVLGDAVDTELDWIATLVDINQSTRKLSAEQTLTGQTNGTTPEEIVPSPAAGVERHLAHLTVSNLNDAAVTVMLQYQDGTNVGPWTLDPGDVLEFTPEEGFNAKAADAGIKYSTVAAPHALLSSEHSDTVTAAVVAGDLIYGNATPKWARRAIGAAGALLYVAGGFPTWSDSKLAYDGTNLTTPTMLAAADATYNLGDATHRYQNLWLSSLTSGRVAYATTNGQLATSANFTFDGTSVGILNWLNVGSAAQAAAAGDISSGSATNYAYWKTADRTLYLTGSDTAKLRLSSPQTLDGFDIGQIDFYNTTGNTWMASIFCARRDANNSGELQFYVSNAGTLTNRLVIDHNGVVTVGNKLVVQYDFVAGSLNKSINWDAASGLLFFSPDATSDIGDATRRPRDLYLSRNLIVGGTSTFSGNLVSNADGTNSVGTAAVRWLSMSAEHYYVYGAASDANPTTDLSSASLAFGPGGGSVLDAYFIREGANSFSFRNSVNAQELDLYNTYTSGTNFEKLRIIWTSNIAALMTQKGSGGGSIRALAFGVNNGTYWQVDTSGNFTAVTDASSDLGDATHRPRDIYWSRQALFPDGSASAPSIIAASTAGGVNGYGFYYSNACVNVALYGNRVLGFDVLSTCYQLALTSFTRIGWAPSNVYGDSIDTALDRVGVGTLAQRDAVGNGAMEFRVYGAAAKYARLFHDGTDMYLDAQSGRMGFEIGGAAKWLINTSSFEFSPVGDNTTDLAASGTRIRSGYFGTQISIGSSVSGTGYLRLSNNAGINWRNAAGSDDIGLRVTGGNILISDAGTIYPVEIDWLVTGGAGVFITPNLVEQKNGATAQTLRVYGNTTGPRYLSLSHNGSSAILDSVGGGNLYFSTGGSTQWFLDTSGHVFATTDNTYDLGASGANRARSIYWGTQALGPDGNATNPAYSFSGATGTGFYRSGANVFFAAGGTGYIEFANDSIIVDSAGTYGFSSGAIGAAQDVILSRIGAAILGLVNSTTAQEFRVYGTTTGPVYTRIINNGTSGYIGTNSGVIFLDCGGAYLGWNQNAFYPNVDNAYALGISATNRWTSLYLSTALIVGTTPATAGAIRTAYAAAINFRNNANGADYTLIESLTRNSVTDCVRVGGSSAGVIGVARSFAGAPSTSDLSSGEWMVAHDTTNNRTFLYYNDAGTMKAAELELAPY